MDGGSLTSIVMNMKGDYSEEFCKYVLNMVALGLHEMHTKKVLHRDIKSDNILCSTDGQIKIADLGFSVFLTQKEAYRRTRMGTAQWVSPEIIQKKPYSKEVDVWAFGIFAYELATGMPPFPASRGISSLFNTVINSTVPPIPDKWSPAFRDFIDRCLDKNGATRWTIA